jgi:hypothetical protein
MRKPEPIEGLPTALQFNPRWWWDPAPWWLINEMDKAVLNQLGAIQLQLQKEVLAAQMKSVEATMKILAQQSKG